MGKLNNITVTEDQLFWMFRYCLSRKTYAVSDGADAIITNWKFLSINTKKKIKQEINNVYDMMHSSDRETWQRVLALDYDENLLKGLEEKGWKSGSAEEFLTDSNPDNNPDTLSGLENTDSASFQSHCTSCGVPWELHMGIAGTCAENAQLRKGLKQAKEGKFSKTPPKIKQKKKTK